MAKKHKRLLIALIYIAVALAFICIDATCEWFSPIVDEFETIPWTEAAGVRNGAFFWGNHDGPAGGFAFLVHTPKIFPIPLYAGAGPDNGGVFIAVWFVALIVGGLHAAIHTLRAKRRALRPKVS